MRKKYSELSEEEKARSRSRCAAYKETNREALARKRLEKYAANRDSIRERKRAAYARLKVMRPEHIERLALARRQKRQSAQCASRKANAERVATVRKQRQSGTSTRARELHLRSKFGIGAADYERMLEKQSRVCAICKRPESRVDHRTRNPCRMAVDHCHETGRIRGLLCFSCNTGIALLDHNPNLIDSARLYLDASSS